MAKRNFITTELQLHKLRPATQAYDVKVKNAPGLTVRVNRDGTKSFRWDRGARHKPRVITHGVFPLMSLKEALAAHEQAKHEHRRGTFALAIAEDDEAEGSFDTIADIAAAFYRDRILTRRKRPEEIRRLLDVDVLPLIGGASPEQITTPICRRVVLVPVRRGSPAYAATVLAVLKQLFRYAVSIGAMQSNPAQSLEPDLLGAGTQRRSRKLDAGELAQVWPLLGEHHNTPVGICLQVLLLTGLRSGELRQARWDELDMEARTLTIPVSRQKLTTKAAETAQPFVVPLSAFALALLQQLRGMDPVYIFPGKDGPFSFALMTRVTKRISADLGIEVFKPHDLRRTCRTGLSLLKVTFHVAERCLNHSLGKIVETYDVHDYLDERRDALERWSDYVRRTVGADAGNVVELGARHG